MFVPGDFEQGATASYTSANVIFVGQHPGGVSSAKPIPLLLHFSAGALRNVLCPLGRNWSGDRHANRGRCNLVAVVGCLVGGFSAGSVVRRYCEAGAKVPH